MSISSTDVVWLRPLGVSNDDLTGIPSDMSSISNPTLLAYLEEKYPHRRFLIENYISNFLHLPGELLQMIALFVPIEKCALFCQTNTTFNALFLPISLLSH